MLVISIYSRSRKHQFSSVKNLNLVQEVRGCMIHQTLKSAEITAEIVLFVVFTVCYSYDSMINYKNYICSGVIIMSEKQ